MYQGSYRPYFENMNQDKDSDEDSLKTEYDEIGEHVTMLGKMRDQPNQLYELIQDRPHYILPHELSF